MIRSITPGCIVSVILPSFSLLGWTSPAAGEAPMSYPSAVKDASGISEGAASAALGVPDYEYIDGAFVPGASVVYVFPAPLDDITGDDLLLLAFINWDGPGSSTIQVDARAADSDPFVEVATIITADARVADAWGEDYHPVIADGGGEYAGFDHVHPFAVDFDGAVRKVSEVRLTNLEGDDLKLDALEGIHPALSAPQHAVEMRIFRRRDDSSKRFALRFKNLGSLEGGVPMSGFTIEHIGGEWIDQTNRLLYGPDGEFAATPETTAGHDSHSPCSPWQTDPESDCTDLTEYAWSIAGSGLDPGEVASHRLIDTIDLDTEGDEFLENMLFTVTFVDGISITASWSEITASGTSGSLFCLYEFPPGLVTISEPRPTFYYEFADSAILPEDICQDCSTTGDNGDGDGDGDGDIDPNGSEDPPPSDGGTRMCGVGMVGGALPILLALLALQLARPRSGAGKRARQG